ncbi:MAG: putative molecular chaperone,hSP90 family [Candidatus Rokubacteria bacterium]|nr:putative molecular chaperone,hSP90 family [Candidatus Rokubacteria bacterium]
MGQQTLPFQAEVGKLLDIVTRSLYSHKEIFLRELISNAADACDRLRYLAVTAPETLGGDAAFRIVLVPDKAKRTLTVSDNGIGMDRDELAGNLGTIARSGTQAFLSQLSGDAAKDVALIGQFGVGFYSAFMVAKTVDVLSRRAGGESARLWSSDGRSGFTIGEGARAQRGTDVILHLDEKEVEFLDPARLAAIVRRYSDHVAVPIVLARDGKEETLNTASALWTRPAKDIGLDQYKEFYHHVAYAFDDPWLVVHNRVEGVVAYTNLLFVPSTRPFDIFHAERKTRVRLYVKRVFITDDCEGLLPGYLRFLRGIVDSEDLSLNISRESLQHDPKLAKIRSGLVKRVLGELKKQAEKKPDGYAGFWDAFGAVLKEGIYEDAEHRDRILELAGDDAAQLAQSPQLEGFRARGVEVLLLTDPVDEFWIPAVRKYKDKPFKSATRGLADIGKIPPADASQKAENAAEKEKADALALAPLVDAFKRALGKAVKDVRASQRLTESPVCLVADEGDVDIHLERLLKQHRQISGAEPTPRILELNPGHPLIRKLAGLAKDGTGEVGLIGDAALLLMDQARIVEGEPVADGAAFARRFAAMLEKGLAG